MTDRESRIASIRQRLAGQPSARGEDLNFDVLTAAEMSALRAIMAAADSRTERPAEPARSCDLLAGATWLGRLETMTPPGPNGRPGEVWQLTLANGATLAGLIADAGGGASADIALRLAVWPRPGSS